MKSVIVDYYFEQKQNMRVTVYDIDDFNENASVEQNLLGSADFRLDQVISSPGASISLPLIGYHLLFLKDLVHQIVIKVWGLLI